MHGHKFLSSFWLHFITISYCIVSNQSSSWALCEADLLHCEVWLTAQQGSPTSPHPDRKTGTWSTCYSTKEKLGWTFYRGLNLYFWGNVTGEYLWYRIRLVILFPYHSWRDWLSLCHRLYFVLLVKFLKLTHTHIHDWLITATSMILSSSLEDILNLTSFTWSLLLFQCVILLLSRYIKYTQHFFISARSVVNQTYS